MTGHSYIVYGPLCNGATTFMFEGVPTYPDAGRYWDMTARHRFTQLYTAPTGNLFPPLQYIDIIPCSYSHLDAVWHGTSDKT